MTRTPLNGQCATGLQYNGNSQITNSGYTYDQAGRLLTDPATSPMNTYTWDAEGRLSKIAQNGNTYSTSTFNGHGQAVESVYPGFGNLIVDGVFDPAGRELGSFNGGTDVWWDRDIWAAGRMIAQSYSSNTYFLHANALGSDTQITDLNGTVQTDFIYYPWQDWTHAGVAVDAHFAGFEQSEGPNFGTPTRQYSGGQGRWLTPDPDNAGADPANPQSWNAYAYAGDNPTTHTDPSGETYEVCQTDQNGKQTNCALISDEQFEQFEEESSQTLSFTGSGAIYGDGTEIGTYEQTSVDVSPDALSVIEGVNANHPGDFILAGAGASVLGGVGVGLGLYATSTAVTAEEVGGAAAATSEVEGTATVDDILQGAQRIGSSSSDQFAKSGGIQQAESDFKSLAGREEIRGPVRIKELPDGRRAVLRTDPSTWGRHAGPSIDIQPPGGGYTKIKVRY